MALGHEPNGACVWNSYRGFDSFEEYCTIVKHRRVDKVRKGEDHYHYRCANRRATIRALAPESCARRLRCSMMARATG